MSSKKKPFAPPQASPMNSKDEREDRRQFIKRAAGGLAAGQLASQANAQSDPPKSGDSTNEKEGDLFQPESFWKERIKAPDDGKQLAWFVDTRRCIGCHGCEVSCKSENDVPLGNYIRQTFYQDVGEYPQVARMFLPMACQHCEDAPCIKSCPCGALHKGEGGSVLVDYERCCGHGKCVDACPYGAIYLDPVAKQAVKCHNCFHRTEQDMEPACVSTCPSEALHFGDLNDEQSDIRRAMREAEEATGELQQLRADKQTKPRMWFAGDAPAEVEPVVPQEGESYGPDAYNIYRWNQQ